MLEDANLLDTDGDNGSFRTTATSISVGGTAFATNLFWQPIQDQKDFMPEIEEASTEIIEGADLFAVKGGKAPQFGICVSQEGYKTGTNVAAIALSTALSNMSSIVGVFKVGNLWWYFCSRNDVILSDGDMVYLDEEEAKKQLLSMLTVPDWDKKYAPAEWGIEDTVDGNLTEIFEYGKRVKLQKISKLRGTKLLIVVAAIVIVGAWIGSSIMDYLFAPTQRKIVAPVRPKTVQAPAPVRIPKPWEDIPDAMQMMDNCHKGILSLTTLAVPGWSASGVITCTGETAATSWKLETGMISWAEDAMKNSGLENLNYMFNDAANNISVTLSLPKINKITVEPDKKYSDLKFELIKKFHEMGLPIQLFNQKVQVKNPNTAQPSGGLPFKGKQAAPQFIDYNVLGFKIQSEYAPVEWVKFLTKFSSFSIKTVGYNVNNNSWNYEGVFYVL